MKLLFLKNGFIVAILVLLVSCDAWKDDLKLNDEMRNKNLYEVVTQEDELSVFASILQRTGYDTFLQKEQSLTVFAPTNSVIQSLDLSNVEELTDWVKNYITYLSYYTNASGKFDVDSIRMINGKVVTVNDSGISGAGLIKSNLTTGNGVLHIIDNTITERKNIWEYLQTLDGYTQIDYIKSITEKVMDTEKSVQIGLTINGSPIYDTIWVEKNTFLDAYPIDNESKSFTFLLLQPSALNLLKTKYAKYMIQEDVIKQEQDILFNIVGDMILYPVDITSDGRYVSLNDSVLVDVNELSIVSSYQASNGKVYILNNVDVKMYENKIKTQLIEAEDYTDRWDANNGWEVRYRSYASNGMDVVLKGTTRNYFEYSIYYADTDTTIYYAETKTFQMHHRTSSEPYISKSTNAYLQYTPTMYSTSYRIYWRAYDDKPEHFYTVNDTIVFPMKLEQKMLVSFPGKAVLARQSDGTVKNNFNMYSFMAATSYAGVMEESMLTRYKSTATDNLYLMATSLDGNTTPYVTEDEFGKNEVLKCPTYGTATLFVANTVREQNTNAGIIFLDYIRLEPIVDPND